MHPASWHLLPSELYKLHVSISAFLFFPSLLFFLLPEARPLLIFLREQRGELPNHSSLVLRTVNTTHNGIIIFTHPFNKNPDLVCMLGVTGESWSYPVETQTTSCYKWPVEWWSSWLKAATKILIIKIVIKTLLILSCSQPDYVLTLKPQTIC